MRASAWQHFTLQAPSCRGLHPSATLHPATPASSPPCPQPQLEKATWDLRAQLAALARVLGRAALGVPGAEAPGGAMQGTGIAATHCCVCFAMR